MKRARIRKAQRHALEHLRDWAQPDLDDTYILLVSPDVLDKTAPTNGMRFYRLSWVSP